MDSIDMVPNQDARQYSYPHAHSYKFSYQQPGSEMGSPDNTLILLINSIFYFLECVYILYKKDYHQLVVLHHNRVLTYKNYKTLRGAKIAFQRLYKNKAWKIGVKAQWTPPYQVDYDWLEKKDEVVTRKPGILRKPRKLLQPLKAYSI